MTRTVWLARHADREDFADPEWVKTASRPFDPGLSTAGLEQAAQLAARLTGEDIAYIFASPFLRTAHTASIVADALDLTVFLEPGIEEWLNPNWFPGMPDKLGREELAERFPRIDLSYSPRNAPAFPETEEEALLRSARTARGIAGSHTKPILLVGHGVSVAGAIRGLVPDVRIAECPLCSLFRVVHRDDRWHLDMQGDVSHLDHSAAADRFN